jgi:hypothetical protein
VVWANAVQSMPSTVRAMTIEMNEAIARILLSTDPVAQMRSRWHRADGSPHWEQVRADINDGLIDAWSGGEQRMARAALAMHDIDLWAVDAPVKGVIAEGLHRIADEMAKQAAEGEDFLAGLLSRGWVVMPTEPQREIPPL